MGESVGPGRLQTAKWMSANGRLLCFVVTRARKVRSLLLLSLVGFAFEMSELIPHNGIGQILSARSGAAGGTISSDSLPASGRTAATHAHAMSVAAKFCAHEANGFPLAAPFHRWRQKDWRTSCRCKWHAARGGPKFEWCSQTDIQ